MQTQLNEKMTTKRARRQTDENDDQISVSNTPIERGLRRRNNGLISSVLKPEEAASRIGSVL